MHRIFKRRQDTATAALRAYQACGGADGDDLTDIGDLMVNLLHLARAKGMDDEQWFIEKALDHFQAEERPDDIEEDARRLYDLDNPA